MRSGRKGGLGLLIALGICLPCLIPILGISLLAGGGASAIGSFFSDNALLVAAIVTAVMLVAIAMGLLVRWGMYGATGIRFLDRGNWPRREG